MLEKSWTRFNAPSFRAASEIGPPTGIALGNHRLLEIASVAVPSRP